MSQPRVTQRLERSVPAPFEQQLRPWSRELAAAHPRSGYRRLHASLNREGFGVNHKRVQRLCRDEGLRVRITKRQWNRIGCSTISGDRLRAQCPNHVRALDFAFEQTPNCRTLKYLNITDESPKTALAIEGEWSMTGDYMVRALERLTAVPGSPALVRVGNGTEMTSNVIADWCRFSPSGIEFIDPGSPWQNPFVQSFNGKSHEELLAVEQFHTLPETKIMAENYRKHYNQY